ncbi:Dr family adhesin structural subunit [Escherichia coli]|uniref:Dr family adhesin structural subunit n=1 Tax=Escherichia coli TaxID=562 RepID=UPI0010D8DE71|nr:Dr family adhesin structural subunit [Escherichia coli]GDP03467.1 hypothetical protein BvCmsNSNP012_03596 [Escherichia coli]
MKKQITYALVAAALGISATAHANFTATTANNGAVNKVELAFTAINGCVVTMTPVMNEQLFSNTSGKGVEVASVKVSGKGCGAATPAVQPNVENWDGIYHTFNNGQTTDKAKVEWSGAGWDEGGDGTLYRQTQGDGEYDPIVFKLIEELPASGRYTINLTAGTWTI